MDFVICFDRAVRARCVVPLNRLQRFRAMRGYNVTTKPCPEEIAEAARRKGVTWPVPLASLLPAEQPPEPETPVLEPETLSKATGRKRKIRRKERS